MKNIIGCIPNGLLSDTFLQLGAHHLLVENTPAGVQTGWRLIPLWSSFGPIEDAKQSAHWAFPGHSESNWISWLTMQS